MMLRALLLCLILSAIGATRADALLCHPLLGCSCTVTAPDVTFTPFSPIPAASQDTTGQVTVDCTGVVDVAPSVTVSLDDGLWGTFTTRKLRDASGNQMDYNVYTTNLHSVVWGDGTGGSSTVSVSGGLLSLGHWQVTRSMYVRAQPVATTRPGTYTDTIVVRIDW